MADPVAWEPTMKSPYVGMCVWPVPENKENYLLIYIYAFMSSALPLTKHMENVRITGPVSFELFRLLTVYQVPGKAHRHFLITLFFFCMF